MKNFLIGSLAFLNLDKRTNMSHNFRSKKYQLRLTHLYIAMYSTIILAISFAIKVHFSGTKLSTASTCTIMTILFVITALFAIAIIVRDIPKNQVVARLGGFEWQRKDFCRGWLITGTTGCGKTASAMNTLMAELCSNQPNWGGFVIDDKGLYWEVIEKILKKHQLEKKLIFLKIGDKKHSINFLNFEFGPASLYAKIIADVARTCGQQSNGDGFFATQSQTYLEKFIEVIRLSNNKIQLNQAFDFFSNKENAKKILIDNELSNYSSNFESLWEQPAEQRGGVISNIHNFIAPFAKQEIIDLICSNNPTNSIAEIENGKIICVSLPPTWEAERRYIHTLLKMCFYSLALARFGKTTKARENENLLVFFADEAQQIITSSSSAGLNDHEVVAKIREANATLVAATQSFLLSKTP